MRCWHGRRTRRRSRSSEVEGGQSGDLSLELPELPSADCGPDSQAGQLLEALPALQSYWVRVAGNLMQLPMPADGPVYLFGRVTE